jgi:hypothetical protein
MAKTEKTNEHGVKLSDIKAGDTVRYVVGTDGRYSRSKEVTAKVLAVGVKRVQLRSSTYSSAKHGVGDGSGNWLIIDTASTDRDYTNRVWEEYIDEGYRKYRTVGEQWLLNVSKVTLVGTNIIEAQVEEEINQTLRSEERKQQWADEEAAREAVVEDITSIITEVTGDQVSRYGTVDTKGNKVTLTVEQFAAIVGGAAGQQITLKQVDTIEEAKAARAGRLGKVRVNPGGDYRDARDVKVRWSESGTELERA